MSLFIYGSNYVYKAWWDQRNAGTASRLNPHAAALFVIVQTLTTHILDGIAVNNRCETLCRLANTKNDPEWAIGIKHFCYSRQLFLRDARRHHDINKPLRVPRSVWKIRLSKIWTLHCLRHQQTTCSSEKS